jgi:hypothetical protein
LVDRVVVGQLSDGFHTLLDGVGFAGFVCWWGEGDAAGGVDGAAAVDVFGVDLAGLGGAQRDVGIVLGPSS